MTIAGMSVTAAIGSFITSISSVAMSAYVWAATNIALITAVSYYAMWTFVISSIWVGLEDEGYVPTVTVGNFRVAKGIQVLSGLSFFLGLIVMSSIPDLDENIKMVRRIQERTYEIRQQIGKSHDFGSTYSVGVARNKAGEHVTIISTNDKYLSGKISLKSNEIGLFGAGYSPTKMHAEERIVDFCRGQNLQLLGIGASRDVCREVCLPAIRTTSADIVTPIAPEKMVK